MTPLVEAPLPCHDCGVDPGHEHVSGCDTERCTVCGEQWISCGHKEHDPTKAFWTGYWPVAEMARLLGIGINDAETVVRFRVVPPRRSVVAEPVASRRADP